MKSVIRAVRAGLCFAGLVLATHVSGVRAADKYQFAVVPQYGATELHTDWTPVLKRLSRELGVELELRIASSIPRFEAEFLKGTPDFVYLNPYHAVMAHQSQGYLPLLRDSKPLAGILVTRKDGPIKSVKDLNGRVIGFPAPNAFGASLYMRALLSRDLGITFEARYLKTHPNVYRHVIRQDVAAGGSVAAAFDDDVAQVREALTIVYKTPEVASHPVVAHPRVPEALRGALTRAFLDMGHDTEGRALLKEIRTTRPVPAQYERDYLPLERLDIKRFLVVDDE